MEVITNLACLCYIFVLILPHLIATDMLTPSEAMTDGLTLVSAGNKFEFGFFSPASSKNRYLGIWYYEISPQTVIWVGNRNNPLNDSSGIVKIVEGGNLILRDSMGRTVWSTEVQDKSSNGTVLQLLDSGNLVLRQGENGNAGSYLWQSFDHLSDTWLAGMKVGRNSKTGLIRNFTSWKSLDDPSPGPLTYGIRTRGPPLEFVLWKGKSIQFRTGPWNGAGFSGIIALPNTYFHLNLTVEAEEVHYEVLESNSTLTRTVVSYSGEVHRYVWKSSSLEWLVLYTIPIDPCDNYGQCGVNSICTISDASICSCLKGYIPKSSQDWGIGIWSNGCVRKHPLNCSRGEGFVEVKGVKVPDQWVYWMNTTLNLKECQEECLKNCSCTAYANSNILGRGSGCLLWYGDLIDIRRLASPSNQNIYIRVEAADLEFITDSKRRKQAILIVVACSVAVSLLVLALCIILLKRSQRRVIKQQQPQLDCGRMEDLELPTFEMMSLAEATNNFSESNKIGKGGFGPVYKGQMPTGQEIAVKRLSVDSHQGLIEFKNEVILISKLQHRNLVKLLGCCIQGEERMLIYEYMPSKSLDHYIYDSSGRKLLTWTRRFDIIIGVARGLLYLHRDSRLRIIHRDLKASNILLDSEMNPKISDFGTARAFGGDQSLEKTTRVIGTYGYMSPEYIINGLYSIKSDVFSFGVLVLEIVSGQRNRDFCHPDHNLNLLGHAWKLWTEGSAGQVMDQLMEKPFSISEIERCIHVGLLCVQRLPQDRPTMSTVLWMLDGESTILTQPNQPGFYLDRNANKTDYSSNQEYSIANDTTITLLDAR